jgi:hypothetical protein
MLYCIILLHCVYLLFMYSLPSHMQLTLKVLKFRTSKLKMLTVSVVISFLTPQLHNMFQPTWPSSGVLKLLEELLHLYTLS